ncbi:MAG: hypothetical protein WCV92_00985 [Candidatus Buchananbacteria bacterium]
MLVQIIIGLICLVVGFFFVWKPEKMVEFIGEQQWAEKFFGYGRSSTGYQVIGIVIIFVGFVIMTGLGGGMLRFFFGPAIRK